MLQRIDTGEIKTQLEFCTQEVLGFANQGSLCASSIEIADITAALLTNRIVRFARNLNIVVHACLPDIYCLIDAEVCLIG